MKRPKILNIATIFTIAFVALTVGIVIKGHSGEKMVEAASVSDHSVQGMTANTSTESNEKKNEKPTMSVVGEKKLSTSEPEILFQKINNVEMTASNFRREGEKVFIDVCYDLPDNADWTIWQASLKYGTKENTLPGIDAIEIVQWPVDGKQNVYDFRKTNDSEVRKTVKADQGNKPRRCDTVYFLNIPEDTDLSQVIFRVDQIGAFPSESGYCNPKYLEKFQKALDTRNSKVKVKCKTGNSVSGLDIAEKPAEMNDAEAIAIITNNDLFTDVNGIRGPWIFVHSVP